MTGPSSPRWPTNSVLRWFMGWLILGIVFKCLYLMRAPSQHLEQKIVEYLAGVVMVYVLGPFSADLPIVYGMGIAAAVVFIVAVVLRRPWSKSVAERAFMAIMILAWFAIWIEPWFTDAGWLTFVLLAFLRATTTPLDIGVSVIWLLVWVAVLDALNREL